MQYQYIEDQTVLSAFCQQLKKADVLAIDTEFVRTRTLYPKLGLLQVCDGDVIGLIDPIAIKDLSEFWQLLADENITKVIHACSEDLEVFLNCGDCKPKSLIDSQVMMSFLGHGLSIGYAAMVKHFLDLDIDKSDSRTDWTKRPLSTSQLAYAKADVEHLFHIYPTLLKQVEDAGWLEAAKQETQLMINKKYKPINQNELYRNVKMSWKLTPVQLNRLNHLTIWRLNEARKRNIPLGFVAKDSTLFALAQINPSSTGQMLSIVGVETMDVRHQGKSMLSVLKKSSKTPSTEYPARVIRLDECPGYKQIFKRVKNFISEQASKHQQQPENLASKKQINQFLSWYYKIDTVIESIDLLNNWRHELVGEQLLAHAQDNFTKL